MKLTEKLVAKAEEYARKVLVIKEALALIQEDQLEDAKKSFAPKLKRATEIRKKTKPAYKFLGKGKAEGLQKLVGFLREYQPADTTAVSEFAKTAGLSRGAVGNAVRYKYLKKTPKGFVLGKKAGMVESNGNRPTESARKKTKARQEQERTMILNIMAKHGDEMSAEELYAKAGAKGISGQAIGALLRHDWLKRTSEGIALGPKADG